MVLNQKKKKLPITIPGKKIIIAKVEICLNTCLGLSINLFYKQIFYN